MPTTHDVTRVATTDATTPGVVVQATTGPLVRATRSAKALSSAVEGAVVVEVVGLDAEQAEGTRRSSPNVP